MPRWPGRLGDAPFGSLGSFFTFSPRQGSFEVNPPFAPGLIRRTREHLWGGQVVVEKAENEADLKSKELSVMRNLLLFTYIIRYILF